MSGILYVVATPIGNLEDVTLRALRILREVSIIAAEDTRRTGRLLQHYSISTPTTSLHEHNEGQKTPSLIRRLREGQSVALVSDAGTPLVSDPGHDLVTAARAAGIRVESIPGPSAVLAAVSAVGVPGGEFTFVGFPPNRSKARIEWLARLAKESRPVVFFEAPHRIAATLRDLHGVVGPDRTVAIGRELTKAHEELVVQPISALVDAFPDPKGEFTVVLFPSEDSGLPVERPTAERLADEVGYLTESEGVGRREAMKIVGARYGIRPNEMYEILHAVKS